MRWSQPSSDWFLYWAAYFCMYSAKLFDVMHLFTNSYVEKCVDDYTTLLGPPKKLISNQWPSTSPQYLAVLKMREMTLYLGRIVDVKASTIVGQTPGLWQSGWGSCHGWDDFVGNRALLSQGHWEDILARPKRFPATSVWPEMMSDGRNTCKFVLSFQEKWWRRCCSIMADNEGENSQWGSIDNVISGTSWSTNWPHRPTGYWKKPENKLFSAITINEYEFDILNKLEL